MRYLLALWLGKLVKLGCRVLGPVLHKGGTTLPGKVAVTIDPDFLAHVEKPKLVIVVTGTNGKTTTVNMLSDLLQGCGRKVLHDSQGANMNTGIATIFLEGLSLSGHCQKDAAVFEMDERSAVHVLPVLRPTYLVVTNLLRDSILRNASPFYIFDVINGSIPKETKLVLNADDLISSALGRENPRIFYGIGRLPQDWTQAVGLVNDISVCPKCLGPLSYEYFRYNNISRAWCPKCGFRNPPADYEARTLSEDSMTMQVRTPQDIRTFPMVSEAIFNLYDEMAVLSVSMDCGIEAERVCAAMRGVKVVDTRHTEETVGGITLVSNMAKGLVATAVSVGMRYAADYPGQKEVVLMIEDTRDSVSCENTAYEYDVDFEVLNREDISRIVLVGLRCRDHYLRSLLAGIPREKLFQAETIREVPALLQLKPGTSVIVLFDNYAIPIRNELLSMLRKKIRARTAGRRETRLAEN